MTVVYLIARLRGAGGLCKSTEPELKVEVTCLRDHIDVTIDDIKKIHPYEVPVINVIPLYRTSF